MTCTVTIGITAKNEEQSLAACLSSLLAAIQFAEERMDMRFDPVVILDDCTDATQEVAHALGVRTIHSSGGIVEAQRLMANQPPFVIFCDADILLNKAAVYALCMAMTGDPLLQVAYASKSPLPPLGPTLLARAIHCYNRVNGFQVARRYFNGRFFAIRDWRAPTIAELQPRLALLPVDRFYNFHAGVRLDDIYLSRDILHRYGPTAIHEVATAQILFRPPETFEGMFSTYRRMRLEIERLNLIIPETIPAHQSRGYDWNAVRSASWQDRLLWNLFRLALGACKTRYFAERIYYQHFSSKFCPAWPAIMETKVPVDTGLQA